jgi:pescadillo protein
MKKGERGESTQYLTRSMAIRRLQLTLQEFRQLCILKGIYPREPRKKFKGTNKTYYHVKDIKYLEQDKIMETLRAVKVYERKHKKLVAKGEKSQAEMLEARRPRMEFQHIIKERYPSFTDSLRDLDDALCLIFLYAKFPTHEYLGVEREAIQTCQRLAYEWMLYCTVTKAFKKAFLSIKGIYYQAEIMGVNITWTVPYQFTQKMPFDIDYNVMNTFLEFYKQLLQFSHYKLYTEVGLTYPPKRMDLKSKDGSKINLKQVKEMQHVALEKLYGKEAQDKKDISEEFMNTPEYAQIVQREEAQAKLRNLFKNNVFFLNREVPRYSLEFLLPAFGGDFGYEGEESLFKKDSKEITHHIMDRKINESQMALDVKRDYIVPQWVYDCINHAIILPASQYKPGTPPPAHLSPFVDNKAEGYLPKRQEEVNEMKGIEEEVFEPEVDEEEGEGEEKDEEMGDQEQGDKAQNFDDEDSDEDEEEAQKLMQKNMKVKSKLKKSLEKERKELGKLLMTKKQRRLYSRINYSLRRKKMFIEKLKAKRAILEQGDN